MPSKRRKNPIVNDITLSTHQLGDGTPIGLVLKRKPSIVETMCILRILGIKNYNCRHWFDNVIDYNEYLEQCRLALIDFLKGKVDFNFLCNETMCYVESQPINLTRFISLVKYLHSRGIV